MNKLTILLLTAAVCSCAPKYIPHESESVDSVRVLRTVEYRDTVIYMTVPPETAEQTTDDTCSYLATSVAESWASVSGGRLVHRLQNRPDSRLSATVPIPLVTVTEQRCRMMRSVVVKEVEKDLSGWQRTMMAAGYILIGIVLFGIVRTVIRRRL